MKHTPGPWKVASPITDPNAFDVESVAGTKITRGYWGGNACADARLIAAAPDLLEACKRMLLTHGCELPPEECADCREMRAAIAKAEDAR